MLDALTMFFFLMRMRFLLVWMYRRFSWMRKLILIQQEKLTQLPTFSQKVLLLTLNLKNSIYMSFKDVFFRTLTFKITKWKVIHKRTGNNKIRKKIRSYFKKLILAYRFRLIHLRVKDFQGMVTMLLRFLIVLCSY